MHSESIFFVALSIILQSLIATGYPLSQFYSFGSAAGDNSLPANDDQYTSSIPVSVPFPFFGSSYSSVYVSIYKMISVSILYQVYTSLNKQKFQPRK